MRFYESAYESTRVFFLPPYITCFRKIERGSILTSRPKARDGHRYPCPALVFHDGSCYVSRAAALKGTGGDKVL